jgi:HD-GYP domain-containing protein (c-di-GMP phosphodiesterase class II)
MPATRELKKSECLSMALEKRDAYTDAHCGRVQLMCYLLGVACNLTTYESILLQVASRLHDVGKIGVPDHILLKPGSLGSDELEVMRSHAVLGQNICDKIPSAEAKKIGFIIRHHHEAFDGSGYPDGLSGEQIPLCSKIISLADSYDAMLTTRPYHQARSHEQVMEIMTSERGKKTDPSLFDYFEQIVANPVHFPGAT